MKIDTLDAKELAQIDDLVGSTGTKDMAFGGAYDGADRYNSQLSGWSPPLQSADADMLGDKSMLDARSRDVGRNDAYVQGGANIHKDGIVGALYVLNAKPNVAALETANAAFTEDWATDFQKEVEALFTVWAESPRKWVDASGQNTFTSLIRLTTGVYTFASEALATVEWVNEKGRDFKTAVQMVDTDRLVQPDVAAQNPMIRGGIKHNKRGKHLSYFIRIDHPSDFRFLSMSTSSLAYREVKAEKPWGRKQVIYIREQARIDQTRAVSDLVAALKEIHITRKFRDITLQNAVVNAMYAASIESDLPPDVVYQQMGANSGDAVAQYAESYLGAVNEYVGSSKHMKMDGVKVPHMFPGTKFKLHPAGNPGGVGQDFETGLLRYIASSLNISYEELARDFTKTNYSSARAAMASTWRFMQSRKKLVADEMANAIFRLWLEEAINGNRLKTFPSELAGFLYTDGVLNLMFDALTQCEWIGAARGQIDELKETQAAVLRIKYGLSTHEDELARLGKDYRKVYAQLERETNERDERNIVLFEDNSVNAASGTTREADAKDAGTDKDDDNAE
jgi:lambda family phage portal protein